MGAFNWTGELLKYETDTIEFPEVFIDYGIHNFKFYINVIDDENPDNDTLERTCEIDTFKIPYGLSAEIVNTNDVILTWNSYNENPGVFSDGFETGDLSLWDEVIEGSGTPGDVGNAYWYEIDDPSSSYEGDHAAIVNWGYTIDTWMISPSFEATDTSIVSFAWNSSYYWHVDPYDNGDLFVKVSADGGTVWDTLWTFGDIGVWENWTWYETTIDLSDYAGQTIQLAFQVVADDNADITIDNVYIGYTSKKAQFDTKCISNPLSENEKAKSAIDLNKKNNPPSE